MYMIAYMTNLRMPVTEYCFSYNLELYKIAFYLLVFMIRVYYNGVFKKKYFRKNITIYRKICFVEHIMSL